MPATQDGNVRRDELLPDEVRSYIQVHKIDHVVTDALNNVIKHQPTDPIGHFATEIAKRASAAPRFAAVRLDVAAPRCEMRFDVVMAIRGIRVRIRSFNFAKALLREQTEGEVPDVDSHTPGSAKLAVEADRQREEEAAANFVDQLFDKVLTNTSVYDFLSFPGRCKDLATMPPPNGKNVDALGAIGHLMDELLLASVQALHISVLDFLQSLLHKASHVNLASPPLHRGEDLVDWRKQWPRLALPIFHGGQGSSVLANSLQCLAALTPFGLEDTSRNIEDGKLCPPLGWVADTFQRLQDIGAEAVKELQKNKETASLAVNGVAYCAGGLQKSLQLTQKLAETVVGTGREAETYGILWAAAGETWSDEACAYEMEQGKRLKLEDLVDLYDELLASGWLQMIVNPFRLADALAGCELLRSRRPHVSLVFDFGEAVNVTVPKNDSYGCVLHMTESVPTVLQRYAERAPEWHEAGCARCAVLSAEAALYMPDVLVTLLACRDTDVLCLARDTTEAAISAISERADGVLRPLIGDDA